MKIGDLVWIVCASDGDYCGFGLYLGLGVRGRRDDVHKFLWCGVKASHPEPEFLGNYMDPRIATFDHPYWEFEVINESW